MLKDNASVEQATLRYIRRGVRATPPLLPEQAASLAEFGTDAAYRRLWEEAERIAYATIQAAVSARRLPRSCLRPDVLQEVFLRVGAAVRQWQPECAALGTFLTPRILGAALRAASQARRGGLTGAVEQYEAQPDDADSSSYDEGRSSGEFNEPSFEGMQADTPAPDAAADWLKLVALLERLPTEEAEALRRVYGLEPFFAPATLREAGQGMGGLHPEQVRRLVQQGLRRLRRRRL